MKKMTHMLCVVLAVVVVGCDSDTPVEHVSPQFVTVPTGTDSVDVDRMVASLDSAATVYAAGTLRTAAFGQVVRAYLNITSSGPTAPPAPLPPVSGDTAGVSLQDLATLGRTYRGLRGGLYPSGNVAPTPY